MAARAIVFGPTGNVGSIAARTAQKHGVKVFLAMRDTSKLIPGLNPTEEIEGSFERVQADLSQPDSIIAAVKQTKATTAFMYLAHGSPDHMKAALEAFKSGGISFIVFLSSFTIKGDLNNIQPNDRIPYIHARVELNLEKIYGHKNYVALRPGAFATNTLRWRNAFNSGSMQLDSPSTRFDFITPVDMGRVAGSVIAKGQQNAQHIVYLYGPNLLAQKDALAVVAKALGKELDILPFDDSQQSLEQQAATNNGSRKIVVQLGAEEQRGTWFSTAYSNFEEGVSNVLKYTGLPATSFKQWVEENTERYSG